MYRKSLKINSINFENLELATKLNHFAKIKCKSCYVALFKPWFSTYSMQ